MIDAKTARHQLVKLHKEENIENLIYVERAITSAIRNGIDMVHLYEVVFESTKKTLEGLGYNVTDGSNQHSVSHTTVSF